MRIVSQSSGTLHDHHGKARIGAIAKLRVIHQDRGGVVGIDSKKGIGH